MAAVRSLAATVFDLGRSALAERLRPSCPDVPAQKKGPTMSLDLNGWAGALRHALRTLRRSPGFAATVVGTLGLAIGTITAVFAVLDRVLLSPLPYAHPERLVAILGTAPGSDMTGEFGPAAEFLIQYKDRAKLVEDVGIFNTFTNSLRVGDRVERIRMGAVSRSLFSTLGERAGARPPAAAGGPGPRGRDQRRPLALVVRLGPERRRPLLRDGGPDPDHRRRDAPGVPLPEQRPAAVAHRRHSRRGSDAGRLRLQHDRPPRAGRVARGRRSGADGARAPAARALRRLARLRPAHRALSRRRAAPARPDARPRRAISLDPLRRRRHRPGDRLRQRGEPLHGARRGPPARPRRAARDRGLARAAPAAADGGGARGGALRRRPGRRPRLDSASRCS